MAEYKFLVIGGYFIVHSGFKNKEGMHVGKEGENAENRNLYRIFKNELKRKYVTGHHSC